MGREKTDEAEAAAKTEMAGSAADRASAFAGNDQSRITREAHSVTPYLWALFATIGPKRRCSTERGSRRSSRPRNSQESSPREGEHAKESVHPSSRVDRRRRQSGGRRDDTEACRSPDGSDVRRFGPSRSPCQHSAVNQPAVYGRTVRVDARRARTAGSA